jgi:trehalose 6-phosphate synthase/phosphatase
MSLTLTQALALQGDDDSDEQTSMVVVSEFVGCSPSVSGAIRVNPWSIDAVADGIYKAIKMQRAERHLRHEKHWRYISQHTVRYWTEVLFSLCAQAAYTRTG